MTEKMRILNLLKDGAITPEEAENLLSALEGNPEDRVKGEEPVSLKDTRGRKPKKLRIQVDSNKDGADKAKVNVNIPISLIRTLGPIVKKSIPNDARVQIAAQGVDLDALMESLDTLIESGMDEDIVNIDTDGTGEKAKVRIYVE